MTTKPSTSRKRRLGRRARFVLAGLAAGLIVAVPLAWASHDFTDVSDVHPFHADIAAVKDAGITAGKTCVPPGTPPTYCPSEPITREAMAAFMWRGGGRIASEQNPVDVVGTLPVSGANQLVTDADLLVGGVNGEQLVFLQATFTASAANPAPCNFGIRLWEGGVGATQLQQTFDEFDTGPSQRTFTISDVVLATSGFHQYELSVAHSCSVSVTIQDMNMIAATFPFGGLGTNLVIGSKDGRPAPSSQPSSSTSPTG